MNKLIKLLLGILICIILLLIYWISISYLLLDINPLHWSGFFRFTTIIVVGSLLTMLTAFILIKDI